MLDVDNFKAVNDAHGHPYGDEVLRSIGKGLRIAVSGPGHRGPDGGEEFAMIVPDRTPRPPTSGGACARRRQHRSRFGASTSPARRGSRRIRTTPRTPRASASSPRARSTGRSAAARAARAASTPGTCRSRWTRRRAAEVDRAARRREQPDHPGLPAGGGPRERAPGRLRGAVAVHELAEALTRGVVRPGARLWPRARPRGGGDQGRASSRWGGRSGPTSRSTSARPR